MLQHVRGPSRLPKGGVLNFSPLLHAEVHEELLDEEATLLVARELELPLEPLRPRFVTGLTEHVGMVVHVVEPRRRSDRRQPFQMSRLVSLPERPLSTSE